ncbi:hypothetical protein DZ858_10550 [Marixanthomonas ophiurae]|uniref:Uncharacterized protein n=1 Tax=Marixanthomonas ophiurae TaxID=387659 RepID=A0A3E1Q6C1_9FLAO|nr:hypothetical protein DZ858_10550 [Marixanthomonas ophiurae]
MFVTMYISIVNPSDVWIFVKHLKQGFYAACYIRAILCNIVYSLNNKVAVVLKYQNKETLKNLNYETH